MIAEPPDVSSSLWKPPGGWLAVTTWSYDASNRMVSAISKEGTITYLYDANGNLKEVDDANGDVTTMLYDKE